MKEGYFIGLSIATALILVVCAAYTTEKDTLTVEQFIDKESDGGFTDGQEIKVYGMATDTSILNGVGTIMIDNQAAFRYSPGDFPEIRNLIGHNVILTLEYHTTSQVINYEVVN